MNEKQDIRWVVEAGLCTCCGTCRGICPRDAIRMTETPGGLLFPVVDPDRCNGCGLCHEVCPGWHVEGDPGARARNPFVGPVLGGYLGWAADPEIRNRSTSGGATTALALHALEQGMIDSAFVTRLEYGDKVRASGLLADNAEKIIDAIGSKYCPSAANTEFRSILKSNSKVAVVGLGCQIHAVENIRRRMPALGEKVVLTLGLFCGHILSNRSIDYLFSRARIKQADASGFGFRWKGEGGWPGQLYFESRDGRQRILPRSIHHRVVDAFTPPRCLLCFDRLNILADISLGDPWELDARPAGATVILARTERGMKHLADAVDAGVLELEPVETERIIAGQGIRDRRERFGACTTQWRKMGKTAPDFGQTLNAYGLYSGPVPRRTRRHLRWVMKLERPWQRLLFRCLPYSLPVVALQLRGREALTLPILKSARWLAKRVLKLIGIGRSQGV